MKQEDAVINLILMEEELTLESATPKLFTINFTGSQSSMKMNDFKHL